MPSESQVDVDSFVTTWRTTTPGELITIPTGGTGGTYTVDWGDGIISDSVSGDQDHLYDEPGDHQVSISGDFTHIFLNGMSNAKKLLSIDQWGAIQWSSMESSFNGASNMVYRATDTPDLLAVRNMSYMFHKASSLNGDLSGWDVSGVTDMSDMFSEARSFNSDLSGWDVSGVTDMSYMFSETDSFNSDLSGWDVSGVTDMSGMFGGALSFNSNLSGWDVSGVTDMSGMFADTNSFNSDLSGWDTSSVTDMSVMFAGVSSFNGDLSGLDTSSVTDMGDMFYGSTSFNGDISGWDTSSVTDMSDMFGRASSFNGDISGWDVSNVVDISYMFRDATSFNGDISRWDVSDVVDMESMFSGATSFNGDISDWDTSSVTATYYTFRDVPTTKTGMSYMFRDATSFNGDLSEWDVSDVVDMSAMFLGATSFNGDISDWDTSSVTHMSYMFQDATSFNGDISDWDISSATSMDQMFNDAIEFDQNLGKWYIVLDSTSVEYDSTTLHVATISPQNAWLRDNQNIVYSVGSTDDGDQFEIDGNVLRFKSTPDGTYDSYALTILSSGDFGESNSRDVVITVTGIQPDIPLNIDAGSDQTVSEGDTVMLDGIVIDAGSGTLTYSWSHDSSLAIQLANPASPSTTFTAPEVDEDTAITFTLTVDDGTVTATDSLVVTVTDGPILNNPPVADAGQDQAVQEGQTVTLNGAATDPDDDSLTYAWSHDSTLDVTFNASLPAATFVAPQVDADTTVTFTLTVSDGLANSTDTVLVTVKDTSGDPGFVTTWETVMPDESVTIPASGTYTIDWGDGTVEEGVRGSQTHTYDSAGTHTVRISDDITGIRLDNHADAHKLMSIEQWGDSRWTSMDSAFRGASNMTYNAADVPDLSRVTDMGHMFDGASSFDGDLSNWDVSGVRDMSYLFMDATSFDSDLSDWDVSNVDDMSGMFWNATSFDSDLSDWDVSRVTNMYGMFASASSFDSDLSDWDVSRVTDMHAMFNRASSFDSDLSDWDVSRVTDMHAMFALAGSFAGDVSNWDVSRVTDMADMFRSTQFFNSDISGWDISDTTRMITMLYRADAFDQNLGPWYIVLDNDAIQGSDVPGAVGSISTRNPHLDSQNPEYGIGSGGDSDYFGISGNVLSMLSVPDGDAGPYTVDITSTGDYGTDNSRTYEITVISSDIVSLNSTVEPELDTVVDRQVEPELDTVVDRQVEPELDTVVDRQVEPELDTVVDRQVEPELDTVVDRQVEPELDTVVDRQVEPEPGTAVDTQVDPEPGTAVDTQVEPEPMPDPNQPPICGTGTELVDGTCELIQQDQDVFGMIKGWFESLFGAFF